MGYPIVFDISKKLVVLVGGGGVASRRTERLLAAGAEVCVIAPELTDELRSRVDNGELDWQRHCYQSGDINDAVLVVAATDDRAVNRQIAADARKLKIPVNVVDGSAKSDFSIPAVAKCGSLQLAIDTGGAGPAISAALRRHLEENLSVGWARATEIAARLRPILLTHGDIGDRAQFWRAFADDLPEAATGADEEIAAWLLELGRRSGFDLSAFELPAAL